MTILLIAFALSMDSVAICLANGANNCKISFFEILKISFIFAFFQGFMPFLGYIMGLSFVSFIAFIDHFIAFFILLFLGIKMIKESRQSGADACMNTLNTRDILLGALATSIDALAVGVTFSFQKDSILLSCLVISAVCFVLCVSGFYLGKIAGKWLEKKALIAGGVILIVIGFKILIQHLSEG